jgi:hypothetical protein
MAKKDGLLVLKLSSTLSKSPWGSLEFEAGNVCATYQMRKKCWIFFKNLWFVPIIYWMAEKREEESVGNTFHFFLVVYWDFYSTNSTTQAMLDAEVSLSFNNSAIYLISHVCWLIRDILYIDEGMFQICWNER